MAESPMKIEQQYPELFAQLDDNQRRAVMRSLAAGWHEDLEPTREDVEDLTDYMRGAIDADEYGRRSDAAAHRAAKASRRAAGIVGAACQRAFGAFHSLLRRELRD
ncbi:hypothetical protein [Microbacterium testaceum]|uniref:antitoxin VbhA family protein n=1 Tax=Microbacterium testaceum TaxID=2033 RepID=UPI0025B0F215|nr:hypothetical protein [Microbacterium testaceum]WJS92478.1 hypothetical protein NYQ11_08025 [Microbacterium testaceum]